MRNSKGMNAELGKDWQLRIEIALERSDSGLGSNMTCQSIVQMDHAWGGCRLNVWSIPLPESLPQGQVTKAVLK
jgi:hypothetical protein